MITRRDFLKLGGAALLGIASSQFAPLKDEIMTKAPLMWHGSRNHKYMAFTYDDCYLLSRLQDLEKLLDEYPDFRVTLFPVGTALVNFAAMDADIWKRYVDKGHEIGYHTFDHVSIGVMSLATALEDYDKWYDALKNALGGHYDVRFVRPPYDIISFTLDDLCKELGLVAVLFSLGGGGPTEDVMNALRKGQNGDIAQLHIRTQDYHTSIEAFAYLKEQGFGLETLSRMYADLLREQIQPDGCDADVPASLTRSCVD